MIKFWTKDDDKKTDWRVSAVIAAIIIVPLAKWFDLIPFDYFEAWYMHGSHPGMWFSTGWPIFVWGGGLTLLSCLMGDKVDLDELKFFNWKIEKSEMFWEGTKKAAHAGIFEEIAFEVNGNVWAETRKYVRDITDMSVWFLVRGNVEFFISEVFSTSVPHRDKFFPPDKEVEEEREVRRKTMTEWM